MALNDITIVDGATTKVFTYVGSSNDTGKSAVRADKSASLSEPYNLEFSHQLGTQTKADRHLVKLSETKQDSTLLAHFETGSVHIVFTVPRTVIPVEDMVTAFRRLYIYLSGGTVAYDNTRDILKGSLG
jgi:3-dehydroquinate synthase class II